MSEELTDQNIIRALEDNYFASHWLNRDEKKSLTAREVRHARRRGRKFEILESRERVKDEDNIQPAEDTEPEEAPEPPKKRATKKAAKKKAAE